MIKIKDIIFTLLISLNLSALECSDQQTFHSGIEEIEALNGEIVRAFTTDLCTGYKEGTRAEPKLWEQCCVMHDLRLWAGGTRKQRKFADKTLRRCVKESGSSWHANWMYLGVRLGSLSPWKLKGKHFGNAFSEKTHYKDLTVSDIETLEKSLIQQGKLSKPVIDSFIQELKSFSNSEK